jgi:hypothetical protein
MQCLLKFSGLHKTLGLSYHSFTCLAPKLLLCRRFLGDLCGSRWSKSRVLGFTHPIIPCFFHNYNIVLLFACCDVCCRFMSPMSASLHTLLFIACSRCHACFGITYPSLTINVTHIPYNHHCMQYRENKCCPPYETLFVVANTYKSSLPCCLLKLPVSLFYILLPSFV